ncbi:MAG: hypothetical protein CMI74_07265 [Candidatus Pelagibacter sp.]|jgi:hypothetical protein|nr:hypothetical protein [Candidatus Pelagibacter sp.]|tara:strand:- start:5413 stop:5799 length:387 start_codon:yes stop_codon:yes gene_type:complete
MASELRVNTLKDANGNNSVATSVVFNGSAKAWVEYDGTASGATIGDSFNVSSTDDDATGDYGVNFTNAMGNTKYTCTFGDGEGTSSSGLRFLIDAGSTTSSQELYARNVSNSAQDVDAASVVIHGDLA